MWVDGDVPASFAAASSSSAPAKRNRRDGRTGESINWKFGGGATTATARGKTFSILKAAPDVMERAEAAASGPALTHISSQYPPAQLTAVLKAPTAQMKAAGMVALTLNAADMKALVSYVTSLGGTSAASAATPPALAGYDPRPAPAERRSARCKAPRPIVEQLEARQAATATGKSIFDSQGCAGCHGESGGGGSGPALTRHFQSISASSIDSASESTHCQDESCRHGP